MRGIDPSRCSSGPGMPAFFPRWTSLHALSSGPATTSLVWLYVRLPCSLVVPLDFVQFHFPRPPVESLTCEPFAFISFPPGGHIAYSIIALFVWLTSHRSAVLFSRNKPVISNQSAVLFFSQNKPAPAISHQLNEQAACPEPQTANFI
jgi:hypothetical protein